MKKIKYILGALVMATSLGFAQQTPAPTQKEAVLITGATAHLGNGQAIENSAVGFVNGKINYVGSASGANQSSYAKVINASGKHVYPGFIAANSTLGLVEVDAVKASDDDQEIGNYNPHIRSIIAYNAESKLVESMRPNGLLIGQVVPRGGRISGTSSVVQFDAWNWEDASIKTDEGIHVNWPRGFTRGRWWLGEDPAMKPNANYMKQIDELKTFMNQAKAYLKGGQASKNIPFEAVAGLFNGKQKLYVHVHGEREITDAVNTAKELGINNVVIVGGREAHKVTSLLKANNIPVLLDSPHRLPSSEDEHVKQPYMLAKMLTDAGLTVGIDVSAGDRMNIRNLPFYAGTFVGYGLDKEKAVQMITGNAAKILGIDNIAGTLEVGKDATLFVSEGDALDMRTNILTHAFIQGRNISLETHQTKLWKRYMEKYSRE